MASPGSSTFGRYEVRRRLASGGMGEVYVAEQTGVGNFKKQLALKLMLPTMADDARLVQMFLAEVRLAARLQHPNIVQVFDAGLIDGRYFLSMELVEGATLGTLISKAKKAGAVISAEVICHVARQTLEGLRYAQELRDDAGLSLEVVHRDISPSNILVSRRGEVKLTDFGIAKVRGDESHTAPGEVRGKLAYLSPELLRGASASARSDVFALGATLYRLSALASPYATSGDSDPTIDVLRQQILPLSHWRPELPAALTAAIDRALSKEPRDRFANAAEMLDAFPKGDFEARQAELRELVERLIGESAPAPVPAGTAPLEVLTAKSMLAVEEPPAPPPVRRLAVALAAVALVVAGLGAALLWKQLRAPPTIEIPPPVVAVVAPAEVPPVEEETPALAPHPDPLPPSRGEGALVIRPSKKPAKPSAAALSSPAYLSVQAQPWADVEVNGKRVGQTPLARVAVDTPVAVLRFSNPGFRPVERRLKLSAGEEQKISVTLVPKK